jgi:hypothetical protein
MAGFRVIRVDKGLTDLLACLARWGVTITGLPARPGSAQVNDLLDINDLLDSDEGDEKRVYRDLDRCDPDWSGYLEPR